MKPLEVGDLVHWRGNKSSFQDLNRGDLGVVDVVDLQRKPPYLVAFFSTGHLYNCDRHELSKARNHEGTDHV